MGITVTAPLSVGGFSGSAANRTSLSFTLGELAHALVATGRATGMIGNRGPRVFWEFIHRSSLIKAYLDVVNHGRPGRQTKLAMSTLAQTLDRSEKGNLSYAMGQAITGIFCRQVLDAPWTLHVDRFDNANENQVKFGQGRSRPDLIGLTRNGKWLVAEAKGRSNRPESDLAQTALKQAAMVREINQTPPQYSFCCIASFPDAEKSLSIMAENQTQSSVGYSEKVDKLKFFRAYYQPFMEILEMGEARSMQQEYHVASFGIGIQVGLHRRILEALSMDSSDSMAGILDAVGAIAASDDERSDGTFVEFDWGWLEPGATNVST